MSDRNENPQLQKVFYLYDLYDLYGFCHIIFCHKARRYDP